MIVLRIGIEVGVETAEHGYVQMTRSANRRPAQRTLGRDIDDIGAALGPTTPQHSIGGYTDVQSAIAGQGQTPNQRDAGLITIIGAVEAVLARPNQRY